MFITVALASQPTGVVTVSISNVDTTGESAWARKLCGWTLHCLSTYLKESFTSIKHRALLQHMGLHYRPSCSHSPGHVHKHGFVLSYATCSVHACKKHSTHRWLPFLIIPQCSCIIIVLACTAAYARFLVFVSIPRIAPPAQRLETCRLSGCTR